MLLPKLVFCIQLSSFYEPFTILPTPMPNSGSLWRSTHTDSGAPSETPSGKSRGVNLVDPNEAASEWEVR